MKGLSMRTKLSTVLCLLILTTALRADDKAPIDVTDVETIQKSVSKEITVKGKVGEARWTRSGNIMFINFDKVKRNDFVAIAKKENKEALDKAFGGDFAKAIDGKTITVSGLVTTFKETPQIEVTKPEQVKIIEEEKK